MIRILATGGTIDAAMVHTDKTYEFTQTHVPEILQQGRNRTDVIVETIFLKDSLYMTEADRQQIVERCLHCEESRVIVTHGTDTVAHTAKQLGPLVQEKTVVLLGAITPYVKPESDASFNLGAAVLAVQLLEPGVYVVINGRVFSWRSVRKNIKQEIFEEETLDFVNL